MSLTRNKRVRKAQRMLVMACLLLQLDQNRAFVGNYQGRKSKSRCLQQISASVTSTEGSDSYYAQSDDSKEKDETYEINLEIAKLASKSSPRNKGPAREAYDLLLSQRHPDTVAYNSVLKALAKTSSSYNKRAAELAQDLLEEMEHLNFVQWEENRNWYKGLKEEKLTEEEISWGPPRIRVKPNVRSYSTVMDAWAKQNNPNGAKKAQDLLEKLKEIYDETGDVALRPNVISYNTVISGWAKAGANEDGALHCESLLEELGDLADVISYNAVVQAWGRSGSPEAGERAEEILRSMTTVAPNERTYNTVMHAWSRSFESEEDSARRAHSLLLEMEKLATSNERMTPETISYSTVINAYALSKLEPLKAHKAFGLLQRMIRLAKENPKVRPNGVTYNSVLNACATSCPIAVKNRLQQQDLKQQLPTLPNMVRMIYKQLLEDKTLKPDHFTFGTVLKAVANLFWGEPDQVEFGKSVFREACERGQVSFGVLSQLRQAVPAEVFRDLLPDNAVSPKQTDVLMKNIPKEWTRNVREDKRRRNNSR